jgi:6-phosphogluconolactonase (cycloisomerase 2 family)
MTRRIKLRLASAVCMALLALAPARLVAQNFVYVNDDVLGGANTVSAFSVSPSGALTLLPGSPFSTGGSGGASVFWSRELALSPDGRFLFAANAGSNDISVFSINKATGALTLVGAPVPTGGNDCSGISLAEAVAPTGKFLYATNPCSQNISVFSVASDGTLTPTSFSPVSLPSGPVSISVRPDGRFLAVSLSQTVGVFNIGFGGTLTPVPGSPFAISGSEEEGGLDYKCGGKILFGGESTDQGTVVDVYDVAPNGSLEAIAASPFTFDSGTFDSTVVLFSPFSQLLFVSNQLSFTITDFTVASDGSLTPVSGAPFSAGISFPTGMAVGNVTDPATGLATTFLYVVSDNNHVAVFSVADGGALTLVGGSPFSIGQPGSPVSVVAYPPLGCRVM